MPRQTRRCRCPRCGSIFFTNLWNKVYCNPACTKSAENARRYQRTREAKASG